MTMLRRLIALSLVAALTLGLVSPAVAQTLSSQGGTAQFSAPGPGGLISWSGASETCVNTTTACRVYLYSLPAGFYATASRVPFGAATGNALNVLVPPPIHLAMRGIMSTTSGPSVNVGVNFGGSTATIALINGVNMPFTVSDVPVHIDVWLMPHATAIGANTVTLYGRAVIASANITNYWATTTQFNASVLGTIALNTATRNLQVEWLWGAASNLNSVRFHQRSLQIGY